MKEPFVGPGLWIRIQHRFGPRMPEWFMAGHTAAFGWALLLSDSIFEQPTWAFFRQIFQTEIFLGWLMIILGFLRIGGLIVNGARKDVTPHIRQMSAALGCLIWSGIVYCFASSNVVSTWLAIYPLFAVCELVNMYRAAHDQGESRHGKTG
ncbi:hypothetical protein [Pararhizobium sp.]|uniref:hypothetical protein n=1 Tax=Pararhizobium sp. TaxID=1977563 RepID=UPI0027261AD2|nr:hypothetical protein [Pararhizobium sp.]MDO9417052.1 hypothetical protein [Pararhizobium sp.]